MNSVLQGEESELYRVPPLGQHYSHCWAVEDLEEEGGRGGRAMENIEPRNNANTNWQKESGLNIIYVHVHVHVYLHVL